MAYHPTMWTSHPTRLTYKPYPHPRPTESQGPTSPRSLYFDEHPHCRSPQLFDRASVCTTSNLISDIYRKTNS
eukprot:759790-Hanusia_phi.AAC.2